MSTPLLVSLSLLALCTAVLGLTSPGDEPRPGVADRAAYLADVTEEFGKVWPDNRMVYVVCHGHSVPTGYFNTPNVRPFDSYPHLTHELVQAANPHAVLEFVRTGIGGEQSEAGAKRFTEDVLAKKPDVVTIDYSLNDRWIGLERAHAAWTSMIEEARAAGVFVILLTPTPDTNAKLDDPNDPLHQHARQVRTLAAEHGVGLVDSLAAFERYVEAGGAMKDLMSQSNHPNRAGHELVARELAMWFGVKPKD